MIIVLIMLLSGCVQYNEKEKTTILEFETITEKVFSTYNETIFINGGRLFNPLKSHMISLNNSNITNINISIDWWIGNGTTNKGIDMGLKTTLYYPNTTNISINQNNPLVDIINAPNATSDFSIIMNLSAKPDRIEIEKDQLNYLRSQYEIWNGNWDLNITFGIDLSVSYWPFIAHLGYNLIITVTTFHAIVVYE